MSDGIVGVNNSEMAAHLVYLGLHGLQQRGERAVKIVSQNRDENYEYGGFGRVAEVFSAEGLDKRKLQKILRGRCAIGQVQSFVKNSILDNAGPLAITHGEQKISLAFDGRITNTRPFFNKSDSSMVFRLGGVSNFEILFHLLTRAKGNNFLEKLVNTLRQIKGAYALLFLVNGKMVAVRDPYGCRPLVLGKIKNCYVVASETSAFQLINAEYKREVEPGEIIIFDKHSFESFLLPWKEPLLRCVHELAYRAHPESNVFGNNVYITQKKWGEKLAQKYPIGADVVVPVPDSGIGAAIGYAQALGIPLEMGLVRNHYIGRTLLEPGDQARYFGTRIKLTPVKEIVQGKKIAIIASTLVSGGTMRRIIGLLHWLREYKPREIHCRIVSPHRRFSCPFVSRSKKFTPPKVKKLEEIKKFVGADSLALLSKKDFLEVVGSGYCTKCFVGR